MTATSTPPSTSSPYAELKAPTTARRLLTAPTTGPLAALLLACAFFSLSTDQFLTGGNFSLIIQQVMVVGTLAIGQTLIILTAGIDLSCGAVMAFGSIVIARMAAEGTLPPLAAIGWAWSSAADSACSTACWCRRSRCRRSSSPSACSMWRSP